MQGTAWAQGAETPLSGLGLSWTNSGLAGLSHVEKTSGVLCFFVSLSWFPLQQLRPTSAFWDWAKGWGVLLPAQAFPPRGLSALALRVVGPRQWQVLAGSRLALSHLAEPHRSALSSVSWLSCKGRDEPNPAELLLQQATCQDLLVTASWAQEDWLPVPQPCCFRSWGGTALSEHGSGRMAEKVVDAVEGAVHLTQLVHVVPVHFT